MVLWNINSRQPKHVFCRKPAAACWTLSRFLTVRLFKKRPIADDDATRQKDSYMYRVHVIFRLRFRGAPDKKGGFVAADRRRCLPHPPKGRLFRPRE